MITASLSNVFAQDSDVDLDPMNVSDKKIETYNKLAAPASSSIAIETIDEKTIQQLQPQDFFDLLSRSAGIEESFQGRKRFNFANMRGGGGSIGVIIDGLYLPNDQVRRVLASFPMDAIESVKIVRGSTALTLGSVKAFGTRNGAPNEGFVVITTKKGYKSQMGGSMSYGNFGTSQTQLFVSHKEGDFNFRLTGTSNETDGKKNWNNDSSSRSFLFTGGYDGSFIKANAMAFFSNGMRNMQLTDAELAPGFTNTNTQWWGYDPLKAYWLSLSVNALWNVNQITSFTIGSGLTRDTFWNRTVNNTAADGTLVETINPGVDDREKSMSYHLWHTAIFGDNTLKGGISLVTWYTPSALAETHPRDEDMYSMYVQDEQKLLNDKLTIDFGARVDLVHINKAAESLGGNNSRPIAKAEWSQPAYAVSLGSAYKFDELLFVNARVGYVRTDMDEDLETVGGKDLDPETRFKYEVGLSSDLTPMFRPAVTFFMENISNAKVRVSNTFLPDGTEVAVYDSADKERIHGLEFIATGDLPFGFNYRGSYSYSVSDNKINNANGPHHNASGLIGWSYMGFEANASFRYVSGYYKTATYPCGDFWRYDANIGYGFNLVEQLFVKTRLYGQNLADRNYLTNNRSYQNPGRSYGVKVSADTTF